LLDNFANLINNYKIKYKMLIFFIIRRFETTITIFKIIVLTFLVDIIVFVLLFKKRDHLSKIIENALVSKKREKLFKIKITTSNKQDNDIKIFF